MLTFPIIASFYALACNARQIVLDKGQPDESYHPFSADFDDFVEGLLKEWHAPGLAIAVVHENQTWAKVRLTLCSSPGSLEIVSQDTTSTT